METTTNPAATHELVAALTFVSPSPINRCQWCGMGDDPEAGDVVHFEHGAKSGDFHPRCWQASRLLAALTPGASA